MSSRARSPRIVPGAASFGFVTPMRLRTTCHVPSPPFDHQRDERAARDERHEVAEERLLAVLVVVTARGLFVERAELHGDDGELLALEPADDLADEPALDRVGLAEHEGSRVMRGKLVDEVGAGRTGDVQRAGDDHLTVGGRRLDGRVDRVGDAIDDVHPLRRDAERARGVGDLVRLARAWSSGRHAITVSAAVTPSASSISRASFCWSTPITHVRAVCGNSSASAARTARAPATFFVPSITTSGL